MEVTSVSNSRQTGKGNVIWTNARYGRATKRKPRCENTATCRASCSMGTASTGRQTPRPHFNEACKQSESAAAHRGWCDHWWATTPRSEFGDALHSTAMAAVGMSRPLGTLRKRRGFAGFVLLLYNIYLNLEPSTQ